jgi:hypothetical protein
MPGSKNGTRIVQRLVALFTVIVLSISACSPAATASPIPNGSQTPSSTRSVGPGSSPSASAVAAASPVIPPARCDTPETNTTLQHQAPEVEAMLPSTVAGRSLARWSVRGRCWAELVIGDRPTEIDAFLAPFDTSNDPGGKALASLTYGVAGRSDTKTHPPYFVFVAARPQTEGQITVALVLMFAGAAFHDVPKAIDLTAYEERTIAGKHVYVGTEAMLDQGEHQRGRPYLYQTDTNMFMVVTDDDGWAADAIGQLP